MENKMLLLTDFGFKEPVILEDRLEFEIEEDYQMELNPVKFICPISKDVWQSKILHDARCLYRYCKEGWDFEEFIFLPDKNRNI